VRSRGILCDSKSIRDRANVSFVARVNAQDKTQVTDAILGALVENKVFDSSLNFTTLAKIFLLTSWDVASKATTTRVYEADNKLHVTSLLTILDVLYSYPVSKTPDIRTVLDRLFFTWVKTTVDRKKLCTANFELAIRTLLKTKCRGILLKLIFDGSIDICNEDTMLYFQGDAARTYIKPMFDVGGDATALLDAEHLARMLDMVLTADWFENYEAGVVSEDDVAAEGVSDQDGAKDGDVAQKESIQAL
jgi:hypothetical protein